MAAASSSTISKEEYLKRYLSENDDKKKKKVKKVKSLKNSGSWSIKKYTIVDDDVDLKAIGHDDDFYVEIGDEAPEVIGMVDDRPEELRRLEELKAGKWKTVGEDSAKLQQLVSDKWKINTKSGIDSRKLARRRGSDLSPIRRQSHNDRSSKSRRKSGSDESPSPKSKRQRHDSDSDTSPVRRGRSQSDTDQSPPRRRNDSDSDESPPRRSRADSGSDQSPPRRSKPNSDSDQSPPRYKVEPDSDLSPPRGKMLRKTLDGRKAGLQSAKALKEEIEALKKRERRQFEKMDSSISGRDAKTIVRDRATGKIRNLEEEAKQKALQQEIQAKREAKYKEWGKGLKQLEMQKSKLEDDVHEISKPFARYEGDSDLDKHLKMQERYDDPMLAHIKQKKQSQNSANDRPKYNGPAAPPPNRFDILPGYRWDGVDRSNGFEKARYTRQSNKIALQDEAYKWSVEDM